MNYGGNNMPKVNRKNIEEERERELLKLKLEKANATIDYLAMMTDVELPNEEESEVIADE